MSVMGVGRTIRSWKRVPLALALATPLALTVLAGFGGGTLMGCSSDGKSSSASPGGDDGDGTAENDGRSTLGGGPVRADGGVEDDRCFGISCKSGFACSKGNCVPDSTDEDKDGVTVGQKDCDDADPDRHPGATEICNGKDDDCDGQTDEGFDKDGDGYFTCALGNKKADCNDIKGQGEAVHDNSLPGTPVVNDKFTADGKWAYAGGTVRSLVNQTWWARLTTDGGNSTGALYWPSEYDFDRFEAKATVSLNFPTTSLNEGIAFVWAKGINTKVAGTKYGLSNTGVEGYGVVVGGDTSPFVAIIDAGGYKFETKPTTSDLRDGKAHTLAVSLKDGKITVTFDTQVAIKEFALPFGGYVPFKGRFGYTASAGTKPQNYYVTNVSMTFPNGQSCVL
jgi:hypothetical protein